MDAGRKKNDVLESVWEFLESDVECEKNPGTLRARGFPQEFMLRRLFAGLRAAPEAKVSDADAVEKAARAHKSLADGIAK